MVRPRKTPAPPPPEELVEVTAAQYTEDDDDWDGVPAVSDAVLTDEETATETKKGKGRPGSPLLQATRDYEKANKAAEKARAAAEKYKPLIDTLEESEAAEAEALDRLTALLHPSE